MEVERFGPGRCSHYANVVAVVGNGGQDNEHHGTYPNKNNVVSSSLLLWELIYNRT